jgi:hypothetical protein
MFSVEERDGVRDHVLELAASDDRVIAGAQAEHWIAGIRENALSLACRQLTSTDLTDSPQT